MTERIWFKIGEAAARIGATPKELRYWESVIPELNPRRSKGNLRYYHLDELPRLEKVREWLAQGLTVADCRQLFTTGHINRPLGLFDEAPEPGSTLYQVPPAPQIQEPLPAPAKRRRTSQTEAPMPDLKPIVKALRALAQRLSKPPETAQPRTQDPSPQPFILDLEPPSS